MAKQKLKVKARECVRRGRSGEEGEEEGDHKQSKASQGQRLGRLRVNWNVGGEMGQGKWLGQRW